MTHPRDEEMVEFTEPQARIAFDRAIAAGILSEDPNAENFAGDFMFMGTLEEGDAFNHIGTRGYVYNKQGEASSPESISRQPVVTLLNEIDCRIEHGASSNGHLEFVRGELRKLLHGGAP